MAIKKITETEIARNRVMGNLPDKPSQASLYGEGPMTPSEIKAAFDKLPLLIAAAFNGLVESIGSQDDTSLAELIPTGLGETHTLRRLFSDIASGETANYLALKDGSKLQAFYESYLTDKTKSGENAPTEQTEGSVGSLYLKTKNGSVEDVYFCHGKVNGAFRWQKYVAAGGYYMPEILNRVLSFTPSDPEMPSIPSVDLDPLPKVSETDNDKVLTVEDGVWVAKALPEVEIPDPLPPITEADNNKVLTAEDGVWVAKDLPRSPVKLIAPTVWLDGTTVYTSSDSASDKDEFYLDGVFIGEGVGMLDLGELDLADGIYTLAAKSLAPPAGRYANSDFGNTLVYVVGDLSLPSAEGVSF